jgi:hypothetical protein
MALYKSAYSAFMVLVRSEAVMFHPATGVEINRVPPLTAEFGEHGGTFNAENPLTGQMEEHAIINGHFFDSESAQEMLGWTDEERESVEMAIEKISQREPYLVAKVELTEAPARKPWPTYDELNAESVLSFANALGLLDEALAYEQENKARKTLIAQLEIALEEARGETGGTPAPAAVGAEHEAITL